MSEKQPTNDNIHEDDLPEQIGACEGCMKVIREGDKHHSCTDEVYLCETCAPSYQDMLDCPGEFATSEGNPMSIRDAMRAANLHLAQGGKLTDKVVNS